jgi:UPF0716 protein FxsA
MLLFLLILWPIAELFVIVLVAETIGVLLTILLLLAAIPLGAWALRAEGRAVWRRFNAAVAQGRPPGREVVDGVLVALGGGLLIVPGFITDVLGLLLLLPPTRLLLRTALVRNFQHGLVVRAGRFAGGRGGDAPLSDVDGTATEVDPPPQLRP